MTHRTTPPAGTAPSRRRALKGLGLAGLAAVTPGTALAAASIREAPDASDDRPLDGRVAIVTGARANIGRAAAVELARLGTHVVVHHHTPDTRDQAEETAALCREHGVQTALAVGNLGDEANTLRMFDTATDTFGRLDVFVHNAGALEKGPLAELTNERYDRMQQINIDATFYGFREAARRIEDGGRILGISSSVTGGPPPGYGVYTGGKMFMNGLVFALAKELGSRQITVNAIAPGPIDTPFFHGPETPESVAYISQLAPMGRLGKVEELMPVLRMIMRPESMWLNGETLYVNNGYLQA